MVDLDFVLENVRSEPYAASPLLLFGLKLTNKTSGAEVQNIMLNCQIRIEPTRRHYADGEQERLADLFGAPDRWAQTLHSFLWTHTSVSVAPFARDTRVDLPVPCSYDFNIAATKYFYGLADGEAPLSLHFSGTVFYHAGADGPLQIAQIPWTKELTCRLPAEVWQTMMDQYYPGSTWLRLNRDVFERLYAYRRQHGLPTWEHAVEALLADQPPRVLQ